MKLILIYLILFVIERGITLEIDESGYIAYCPCMGRFGNQADHFLGSLAFAHGLNRTLILPPWVEYRRGESKSLQLPFETYFQVEPLNKFHRVITMHDFMSNIAPNIWPPEKRVSFCYMARKGIGKDAIDNDCNAKNGNPFGPFWDTFGIDFVSSEFYEPLNYDIHHHNMGKKWSEKYPADQWPVYAFTGAPASFPIQEENRGLHQYLIWNEKILEEARSYIKTRLPKGAFIGLHLRNGMDWIRACEHVDGKGNLFASAQCLGYRNEKGVVTMEMCFPPIELITKQIKRQIKQIKELNPKNQIRSIFVASDNNHFIGDLNQALRRMNINAYKLEEDNPHLDLAILGLSNHFIGNCVSSYTSFVKRERDVKKFPSTFWGFPKEAKSHKFNKHEEL